MGKRKWFSTRLSRERCARDIDRSAGRKRADFFSIGPWLWKWKGFGTADDCGKNLTNRFQMFVYVLMIVPVSCLTISCQIWSLKQLKVSVPQFSSSAPQPAHFHPSISLRFSYIRKDRRLRRFWFEDADSLTSFVGLLDSLVEGKEEAAAATIFHCLRCSHEFQWRKNSERSSVSGSRMRWVRWWVRILCIQYQWWVGSFLKLIPVGLCDFSHYLVFCIRFTWKT